MSKKTIERVSYQEVRYSLVDEEYSAESYEVNLGRYYDEHLKCWGDWFIDKDYFPEVITKETLLELLSVVRKADKKYGN